MDKAKILGVHVNCIDKQGLIGQVLEWSQGSIPKTVSYINAHCLNVACQNPQYKSFMNHADLVYADGYSVVLASQLLGSCVLQKVTGRDWVYDFCHELANCDLRLYIIAGRPGIALRAIKRISQDVPRIRVVGYSDGYFLEKSEGEVIREIHQTDPQVLLVGMGVPKQEKWIQDHYQELGVPVCWGVGALFDYVSGIEPPVPSWMNALALEWFWRLLMDPLGKWRRYILGLPMFAMRILIQKLDE